MAMESAKNEPSEEQLDQFTTMAKTDESPIVRLYLSSATQKLPLQLALGIAGSADRLTREDSRDHNLPLMYWYAAEPLADVDATRAFALAMSAGESIPLLREFMLRRIGSSGTGLVACRPGQRDSVTHSRRHCS